jgi:hypothetical protein
MRVARWAKLGPSSDALTWLESGIDMELVLRDFGSNLPLRLVLAQVPLPDEAREPPKAGWVQYVWIGEFAVGSSNSRSALDPQKILDQLLPSVGQHTLRMELHTLDRKLPMP